MMLLRSFAFAVLLVGTIAAPASAAFPPPVPLAQGDYSLGLAAATDAAGATTVIFNGGRGKRLLVRPSSTAPWPAPVALPGGLGAPVGPVVSAAGQGAVAAAWRLDKPRQYEAIAAMVADPDGGLSTPVVVSPRDANGVRHPAVAVGTDGGAVLAYNTNTRVVHLSQGGAIAISLRTRGQAFGEPVVVDEKPSSAPAVAIADDGRGVVAWVRERRVWSASVDAETGTVGAPKALTRTGRFGGLSVAAAPRGAATVAWQARRKTVEVQALHRAAGASFRVASAQTVFRTGKRGFLRNVRLAADEDGRTTAAWSAETFGRTRSVGVNGVTSGIYAAVFDDSVRRFETPRVVFPDTTSNCSTPVVAARTGRAYLAFECRGSRVATVYATRLSAGSPRPVSVFAMAIAPRTYESPTPITLGLDATGLATITLITTTPATPTTPQTRQVLTTTGR
jgi:hypothetical protein